MINATPRPLCFQERDPLPTVHVQEAGWALGPGMDGWGKSPPGFRTSYQQTSRFANYAISVATTLSVVLQKEKQHKFRHTAVPNILYIWIMNVPLYAHLRIATEVVAGLRMQPRSV